MTTTAPTLEDLLAEWWRDSYPHAAPINNQTAGVIVAFAKAAQPILMAGSLEDQLTAWWEQTHSEEHLNSQSRSLAVAFVAWLFARTSLEALS
jgi:hypothetical protein